MDYSKDDHRPIKLSKLRGQHFLTDKRIVDKIVLAAELTPEDVALEVGPGLGVMTRELAPRTKRLIAVELDPLFVRELRSSFAAEPHLEIVEADILRVNVADYGLLAADYKLISNLPYNITSAFLKKFLIEPPAPERIVVMIQKEVAERIIGVSSKFQQPDSNPTNLLGIVCNLYADCSFVCKVPASSFAPPPKVESAVICLKPYSGAAFAAKWGIELSFAEDVIAFASRFFSSPRKKMAGLLAKPVAEKCKIALAAIGESPDSRPAALSLGQWVELWKKMR
jgi:16S rRNA (adenine1518-N6/adenine1519-N6)-dimethyltransferase